MIRLKQTMTLAIALLVALADIRGQAQSVPTISPKIIFNAPTPPSTGRPGRRSDAGSRGCGENESSSSPEPKPLIALVPIQVTVSSKVVFGKTAAEHPTFWFYVPQRSSSTAIFVLQERNGSPIYKSNVPLPKTAGIVSLTLPATIAPLETGKQYHWFFKLYCRSTSPPDSFVDGWIQRQSLRSELTRQIEASTVRQQVRLYAANGFWFEALTSAAELHRTNSGDSAWADLMGAIGLESIAAAKIVTP